jgi:CDP-diacylglycerol--glycerol-3-phosphate 3-phosphatidyltransferase
VFAVAAFTDRLDGQLARSRGLVTAFGTIADPIADKALTGSALVGLSVLGMVPWWATLLMMGREIAITLLRFAVLRHGIIPASRGGKAKTLVQAVAIGFYLLPLPELLGAAYGVRLAARHAPGLAVLLTVATGVDYVLRAMRCAPLLPRSPRTRPTRPETSGRCRPRPGASHPRCACSPWADVTSNAAKRRASARVGTVIPPARSGSGRMRRVAWRCC